MRAVVQRVLSASVTVDKKPVAGIGGGLLVLIGIAGDDLSPDMDYIIDKILNVRIFNDADGVMNLPLAETGGGLLAVSQFTLYGDVRKGRRPSYSDAMPPDSAKLFYDECIKKLSVRFPAVQTGIFGADMQVSLVNDGPVTILLDSRKGF